MKTYTKSEAQKLLLQYHNIDGNQKLSGIDGVRQIMSRLGSIQYDPLNVVSRNADLVLHARVENYRQEYLSELLYTEHYLVDGYDKEMCINTTKDFANFAKVREANTEAVLRTLEYRGQTGALDILDEVLGFVSEHGITGTKDLSIGEVREESRWGPKKLSSAALDYLYNRGDLCVANKKGTQKYFDLTERVIPSDLQPVLHSNQVLTQEKDSTFNMDEFLDWYILRRIRSLGFVWDKNGGAWQGHYLSDKVLRKTVLDRLVEKNEIYEFQIEGIPNIFYGCKELKEMKSDSTVKDYARFLAPLDNLMWDRTMLETVFDFSYRWEVYTPVVKRKYGYYVIPVIYNDRFVGRFEPEAVGKTKCLTIKNWWWESDVQPTAEMKETIREELIRFSDYLGVACDVDNCMTCL